MANISGAKLLAVKALGEKLAMLTVELNGKQGEIKAWKSDVEGLQAGHVFASAETEKKPPYNKPNAPQSEHEVWLKSEKKPSGKGGGVAKSDPAKNAVIEKANANNNSTMGYTNARNASVTIVGWARDDTPDGDINKMKSRAADYADLIADIANYLEKGRGA